MRHDRDERLALEPPSRRDRRRNGDGSDEHRTGNHEPQQPYGTHWASSMGWKDSMIGCAPRYGTAATFFVPFRYWSRNVMSAVYPRISLSFFTNPCPSSGNTMYSTGTPFF